MLMMLKICAIAVVGLVLIALIRSYKPEFTVEAVLCVSIILLYYALDSLRYGFVYMQNLYSRLTYGQEYFPIILKVLAIAYATEFTAALCEDAGEKSISTKVQLARSRFFSRRFQSLLH